MRDKQLLYKQCEMYRDMCLMEKILESQGLELGDNYLDGLFFKVEDNIIDQICRSLGYETYNEKIGEILSTIAEQDLEAVVNSLWSNNQNEKENISPANIIEASKVYTPKQLGLFLNMEIADDITLAELDYILTNMNLWNYPLGEFSELLENEAHAIVVKVSGHYRFVELPSEQ